MRIKIKNPPERVFVPTVSAEAATINAWRTEDDDVLYAGRLSYVQPDEHHG
ncbi:Uncharacterized protein {ECO:0000313/EMBL:AHR37996.1} [Pantoea ananatis]|nr:Uncharacterized protein {ECO:0000313/EMBL:AHR37996.1} [Pantoea ananatis]